MFRIFNGRIKEGRIGEGEKVFYLGAIKGVGGLPKWSNASRFRVRRRRRSFVIQRDFSSESKIVVLQDRFLGRFLRLFRIRDETRLA